MKFVILCALVSYCLCGPKDRVIKEPEIVTNEKHFDHDKHNPEYDHEAFVGKEEAREFEELSPKESKERLGKLFHKVDSDGDGQVTEEEMKAWILHTQNRYIMKDVETQKQQIDLDKNGYIDWDEYVKATYGFLDDKSTSDADKKHFKEILGRDQHRFSKADKDGDKKLITDEFAAFLHPENDDDMSSVVIEETLSDIDKDKDGFISLEEYIGDLYPESDRQDGKEPEWVTNEIKQFKEFRDKNGDGKMDKDEVKDWILPTDYDHVSSEAKHLISESDTNKDGKISKEEMVDKFDLFVGSQATDFGEALKGHEEL